MVPYASVHTSSVLRESAQDGCFRPASRIGPVTAKPSRLLHGAGDVVIGYGRWGDGWTGWELAVRQDGIEQGWAVQPLLHWRRTATDQQIGSVPVHLREQLAITAQKVSATFEFGARVRERMAARGDPEGSYFQSRAAWNRAVARLEHEQAEALRAGRLLATPWRPVPGQGSGNQLPMA